MARKANQNGISDALLIIKILQQIPSNRWITATEIQDNLSEAGIDLEKRRLQRILESIRSCDELSVDANLRSRPYGYRQRPSSSSLDVSRIRLQPQESLLIRLFQEHLRNQLPTPLTRSLNPLFEAAQSTLKETSTRAKERDWLKKVAFVPGALATLPPKIPARVFDAVSEALYRDAKLEITYANRKQKRLQAEEDPLGEVSSTLTSNKMCVGKNKAVVSPLGLVQQEQCLYLVCQFDNYENLRHLALHRISSAKVLDFAVTRPKDFSLEKYISDLQFNYSDGDHVRLQLEFSSPDLAVFLTETPFNKSQTLTKIEKNVWKLDVVLDNSVLIDGWIATWAQTANFRKIEKIPMK